MKTILITGHRGFIGTHLVNYLAEKGYAITGIDRIEGKEVSALTENDLAAVDCVIHLAAQTSVWNEDYKAIIEDNILAFMHIFDLCRKLGKKFIYASSSCSVNVTSPYGFSKMFDDMYAKDYGVGLRFHNVYGKNSRKDTLLGICLNSDEITLYNNGLNYRHFTYIDDVCECVERAMNLPDGLYNVVNPIENSVAEFVDEVIKYKDIKVVKIPEKRPLDKERQLIENGVINLVERPTTIKRGIELAFK